MIEYLGKKGGDIMNVMNISERKFNNLERFVLPNGVFNSESELFYIDEKNKWEKRRFLLKKLNNDFGIVLSNKLFTVNELITNKDIIGISELVIPDKLVSVHGKIVGFTIPLVNGNNFSEVLTNDSISVSDKIKYFKEIGYILENMKYVRQYTLLNDFYLNDIHENNFVLNNDTGKINVVDMDGCKINNNMTMVSLRLSPFSNIYNVNKYEKENSMCGGCYKPSYNTEMYSYIIMFLRFISNYRINEMDVSSYYAYMEYLHKLGISYELIDILASIYSEKDNVNPYLLLDEFTSYYDKCDYKKYVLKV